MTEERLRRLLEEGGLGRVADDLIALARPSVRVYPRKAVEARMAVGASKIGGRPDLPDGVDWPSWHEPMAFLAQFNLAEVAPFDREGALPSTGLLSFFYETDGEPDYSARLALPEDEDPADHPEFVAAEGWRVVYHEGDPATFERRKVPRGLNPGGRFRACAVRLATEPTLPRAEGTRLGPLRLKRDELEALIDLDQEINAGAWEDGGFHLLGYPFSLDVPTLVACDGATSRWADLAPESARRRKIEADVELRWRLLLQLSSSDAAGMDWAGGGYLHVAIGPEALRARDFSGVRLNLQFL